MALIEDQIRKSFGKEHIFEALLTKLSVSDPEARAQMQSALTKALDSKNKGKFKEYVVRAAGVAAEKTVEAMITRLFL
ncbi:hypothetical protein ACSLC0_04545 [Stenotrophomonas muris]